MISKIFGSLLLLAVLWEQGNADPIEFMLFPENNAPPQFLSLRAPSFAVSGFKQGIPTKVIVMDIQRDPLDDEGKALLQHYWAEGESNKIVATLNTQLRRGNTKLAKFTDQVGIQLGKLFQALMMRNGVKSSDLVVVGQGLGAHVAGVASRYLVKNRMPKVGVIVGLDPMEDPTLNRISDLRLGKSDADSVVVYHTDAQKTKMFKAMGTTDIFVMSRNGCNDPKCTLKLGVNAFISDDMMTKCDGLPGKGNVAGWCDDSLPAVGVNTEKDFQGGIFKMDMDNPRKKAPEPEPELEAESEESEDESEEGEDIEPEQAEDDDAEEELEDLEEE